MPKTDLYWTLTLSVVGGPGDGAQRHIGCAPTLTASCWLAQQTTVSEHEVVRLSGAEGELYVIQPLGRESWRAGLPGAVWEITDMNDSAIGCVKL